jgi:hypothetical protein
MNNLAVKELYSEKHTSIPSVSSLLKISLGLILFTMISTALVYAETMSVDVDGTSFDFEYDATGLTVSGIEADTDFISLILTVDVTESSGTFDVTLDRSFFDSTFEGLDDDFIILADGDEPNFSETATTTQSRTLSIELPAGTEEIEIIGSVFGQSVEETPVEETPVEETPVEETPVEETPVEETPVEETPVEETPVEETPADTTPKTQCGPGTVLKDGACVLDERCGPGTVLKDGACVLDERCGPGTVLKDGACVLDSTSSLSSSGGQGMGKESIMGFVVAFLGAGIVAVVFGIIARSQKK